MPVSESSNLKTVSVIVTKEQLAEMRRLQAQRSSDIRRVSFAEITREIVEAGLKSISHVPHMDLTTSGYNEPEAA